ncbi:hypothetical protein ASG31_00830 [Chryseobacterium sp. Leaf404]|uniref:hypothetical protein n=1 Tax=unclassified Chryseobacterium TaxID=2593645 RepID=UPI0006F7BE03|nr:MULTISPECIES: hypothetical protein [unclassified Chryseobacterium]KQT21920.1 hypothetical protein ASG31_00830 [Chryseobacterium sp. Leaf404]
MKVDNKKKIKKKLRLLTALLLLSVTVIFILLIYAFILTDNETLGLICIFTIIILTLYTAKNLLSLKYFEYEHSGEVISIKHYHFWKTGLIKPNIELPKYRLDSFNITENQDPCKLQLSIKASRGNEFCFKYNISNLTRNEVKKIKQSLEEKNETA